MWLLAKLGGEACQRLRLPRVVGELGAGLVIAVLVRQFPGSIPAPASLPAMEPLAEIGIVVLMFEVGLESTIPQMLKVGLPAIRVAIVGVALPMALGFGAGQLLLPSGSSWILSLFIGACLSATSIGITAQVLGERGALKTPEGRVIIGAAVLDDIIGLLVLVTVTGLAGASASGAGMPWGSLAKTLFVALGFLALALTVGRFLTPHLFKLANRFQSEEVLLPLGLGFAFLLAGLGSLAGLATIVGAYAAGLILEPASVKSLEKRELHTLTDLVHPLVVSLSPIFFVLMGAKVDPTAFVHPRALLLMFVLALLGVAGKFLAGYAAGPGLRASIVGWGMVPRGEVGLIFVAVGSNLTLQGKPLLEPVLQAGIVGAILLTTVAGPIGLGLFLPKRP
jgi:Kef-type K+ transport system membrane component KefB